MIHPRTLNALEYKKIILYLADLCISTIGRKYALELKPKDSVKEAEFELDLYREAEQWLSQNALSQNPFMFTAFPDVSGIINRLKDITQKSINNLTETSPSTSHASLKEDSYRIKSESFDLDAFWALKVMLTIANNALQSILNPAGENLWPNLTYLATRHPFPEIFLSALKRCISDDGLLKDESSPELWRIRNELRSLHQNCMRKVKEFAKQYNFQHYLQDEFMTLASDRYVLPLKANFKGQLHGIIHDWSQTGETCYFEPMFLVEINNRLRELKREERQEETKILDYLANLLLTSFSGVNAAFELLGIIDFLLAKNKFSEYLNCNIISFTASEEGLKLYKARHPLLILARQTKELIQLEPVRPLDIHLKPGERILVITGGNAGGKTVCLKTLGLLCAMAMSGLPIPAQKGSHLPWFDRVDAFIGDEQSLDQNVSTFTAQIEHLSKAWKYFNNRGLVLLDEFGSGTDPAEGSALAQSVLDGLLEKDCFSLCATHFPALKAYSLTHQGIGTASMLFDPKTGQPLYTLAYGQVGASQALQVAAEYGLPEDILKRAQEYLLQGGEDSANILHELNSLAVEREMEITKLKEEKQKTRLKLEEEREKLKKERQKLQEEIKTFIAELRSSIKAEKITTKQALKDLLALRKEQAELNDLSGQVEQNIIQHVFRTGQKVYHKGLKKNGTIIKLEEKRNRAWLDLNGVSLWGALKDLEPAEENNLVKSANQNKSTRINSNLEQVSSLVLDVRGLRMEEALTQIEKFLDKAILSGFSQLEIVHGRGTGVLRKQIHTYLRTYPAVESFQLAPEDRGGDGMTIVNLK